MHNKTDKKLTKRWETRTWHWTRTPSPHVAMKLVVGALNPSPPYAIYRAMFCGCWLSLH